MEWVRQVIDQMSVDRRDRSLVIEVCQRVEGQLWKTESTPLDKTLLLLRILKDRIEPETNWICREKVPQQLTELITSGLTQTNTIIPEQRVDNVDTQVEGDATDGDAKQDVILVTLKPSQIVLIATRLLDEVEQRLSKKVGGMKLRKFHPWHRLSAEEITGLPKWEKVDKEVVSLDWCSVALAFLDKGAESVAHLDTERSVVQEVIGVSVEIGTVKTI